MLTEVAQKAIRAEKILFYTGAGISVPSGIPDFRSPGGLWEKYDPFEYATLRAFKEQPSKVWEFLRDLYLSFGDKGPNPAHYALVEIEKILGTEKVFIATQNIDSLHQKAGSSNVFELHGSNDFMHCLKCSFVEKTLIDKHLTKFPYPVCPNCSYPLKPKVTFFDESLDLEIFSQAKKTASKSDLLIGAGSSLEVHPASSLFLSSNNTKAHFNLTRTKYDCLIDYSILGDVEKTLPLFLKAIEEVNSGF
jgi:NAD-dependent deacetylase